MTEQEAIEILKDFNKQVSAKADGAYQSTIGEMACKVAISALEKQIAKKPYQSGEMIPTYSCKMCSRRLGCMDKYCPECGSKIDWSEIR